MIQGRIQEKEDSQPGVGLVRGTYSSDVYVLILSADYKRLVVNILGTKVFFPIDEMIGEAHTIASKRK